MTAVTLPGLVDVHVHARDPGQTHKEDWATVTAAALAGGITVVLAMPNTDPVVADDTSLSIAERAAAAGARCDYGLYAGATGDNVGTVATLAPRVVGLKMFLDQSFGDLRLADLDAWQGHLSGWPIDVPVVVHAEGRSLAGILLLASWLERPLHVCHVSRGDEIRLIARARERGLAVTCEVAPHHLFLDATDAERIGPPSAVKPPLSPPDDVAALWEHLEVIDCFASDHAPHTVAEKADPSPPPGFPGVETMLPLLLTAVHDGRLTLDDVVQRLAEAPRRIFGVPSQEDTRVEVEVDEPWVIRAADLHSRCGWTPFEGREVIGRVRRVVLRGETVVEDGEVVGAAGGGTNVREEIR
jgi:carbamoyl-phosphate synthase/aspartate carbamoyltransferase/dihydroorotase